MFTRVCHAALVAGGLTLLGSTVAQAQNLLNAQTTAAVAPVTFFGGTQLSSVSATYSGTAVNGQTISGTLLSSVYQGGTGSIGLDFYYQFTVNPASTQGVSSVSLSSWVGSTALIGQTTQDIDGSGPFQAGGTASSTATRNSDGSGIQFDFGAVNVASGTNSTTFLVRTNTTQYTTQGGAALLGSAGVAANTSGLVVTPFAAGTTAAPEPGSAFLLAVALPIVGGVLYRRTRR